MPGQAPFRTTVAAFGRTFGRMLSRGRAASGNDVQLIARTPPLDVVATLGHELRAPLAALVGYAELLQLDGDMDATRRRSHAANCLAAARHLDELIQAVLDGGAAGLATPGPALEAIDLAQLLRECCEHARFDAASRGVTLTTPIASMPVEAVGNVRAIRQIAFNLLGNAIKFTPAGGTITASAAIEGDLVVIAIIDTGVGMAASGTAEAKDGRGRGLGLSLVRSLARLHGGEVVIRAAEPRGTLVRVTLPRTSPFAAGTEQPSAAISSSTTSHRLASSCA